MSKTRKTIQLMLEFSIPLIIGVFIALIWANINHTSYEHFIHHKLFGDITVHFLINDIFMVLFFGIAAVEITQSVLPGGDLNPISKAINPLFATVGGVLGPIGIFFLLNHIIGSNNYTNGWGIPTATDIALAWLFARVVFGAKHPAVSFLLLLAIADDAIGLVIIAIFYGNPAHPVEPIYLLITLLAMGIAFGLRKGGIKNYWPYIILGGAISWFGLFKANVHPALALVFIIPFMPAENENNNQGHLMEEVVGESSTISNFEHEWKAFVDIGLLAFGLVNAGVQFSGMNNLTWIILLSLLLGKTLGIWIFSNISTLFGAPLPEGMDQKTLIMAGLIAALGLTVALFVAGQAFLGNETLSGAAKMGALFSGGAGLLAIIFGKILKIKRIV